ncbi:hypothetical protein B0H16DRAFT_1561029 [Mycena metata]|uniref:GATA-type domain-containing protein n=1 Tax=Mycena metata TaxID=1033252 RepID=A0AAD7IK11_9AGAR|nr:hypothetical protein B0H16DRAFT_1561029 [Mycena metata]
MSPHSVLFNSIVEREDHSRTASPALSMHSPRRSPPMLRSPNTYWAGDHHTLPSPQTGRAGREYAPYPQYRTSSLDNSLPTPRSLSHHYRQSDSSNPSIDFTGLIPMYSADSGAPEMGSRGQLMDLTYTQNDWPASTYPSYQRNKLGLWQTSDGQQLSPHQWNSPGSGNGPLHINEYVPYSPPSPGYSSATSSSSPSPTYFLPPAEASTSSLASSLSNASPRRANNNNNNNDGTPKKECFHCHVTSTPLWRREPSTQRPLCNACGLYLQQRNKLRPQELIDADIDDDDTPQIPDEEYTGPKCSHCLTRQTSVWRRSKTGAQVCNACGVYARLRGKERPLSLRRNKIKPRTKHSR